MASIILHIILMRTTKILFAPLLHRIYTFVNIIETNLKIRNKPKRQRDILANIFQCLTRIRYYIIIIMAGELLQRQYMRDGGDKPSNINRALKIRFFVHNIFSYLYIMHVYFACGR